MASDGLAMKQALDDRAQALRELAAMKAEHGGGGGGGRLRAAVFGINDGLVSNASLVVGVAAATGRQAVILAGVAGLVAGAFSMGAGEYISVRTQRELFEARIASERRRLREQAAAERHEVAVIFRAKGLAAQDAERVADHVMADPEVALDFMAREELGLNPEDLGSPMGVAISSFLAFSVGAVVPLVPYVVLDGSAALLAALVLAGIALLAVGAATARLSERSLLLGAARSLAVGTMATAVTYVVGRVVGTVVH
jgi:vacuolar iron transporter family protein